MSELGYKRLLFSLLHPSVHAAHLWSTGVSLLVVHALEVSVPACKAERITATLSSISPPTNHLSTASVWELTSTLIQQSINHNWLKAIPVSVPSVSEGGSVHKQHQQPSWPAFMERDESFHACFLSSHFPPGTDLIYDFCFPPQSSGAIRVKKEQTNAWRALSHWRDEEGRRLRPLSFPQLLEDSKQQHFHMSSALSWQTNEAVWGWTDKTTNDLRILSGFVSFQSKQDS